MEFRSVTVNGAASDEQLELSSSISCSSSSSSSSQISSPVNNSLADSTSPDLSPPRPQAEQSVSITIIAAPVISSARVPLPRLTREQTLKSLKDSIPHAIMLRNLQKSERGFQKDASCHKKTGRRLSKELYMIMSLYALLQGVLFTAVAQSSVFACADWWGPVGIVIAVTLGTLKGALDKLSRMGIEKQEVKKSERRQSAVYDKIEQLYFRGAGCDIDSLEPAHLETFDEAPDILSIFSVRGLLVLGFLVGFSALILASCLEMLCRPCHCSTIPTR